MYWFLFFFYSCVLFSSQVLDPNDPAYAWMDELIERDFASLKPISKEELAQGINQHRHSFHGLIKHLKVVNNTVEGPPGAGRFMLEFLCASYGLPDLELLYFQMDGLNESPGGPVPVFTGARAKRVKNTLLFANWYFKQPPWLQWDQSMREVDAKLAVTPWHKRKNQVIWRGSVEDIPHGGLYTADNWTLHPRGKACWLSLHYPHLINAAFSGSAEIFTEGRHHWFVPGQGEALKKILPVAHWMVIGAQLDYKYQLNLLGLSAPFSRDWQFYSQSVVFRQEMPYDTWWWALLKPWEHYIPVAEDLSDLIEKIEWARLHDTECFAMASQARQLILNCVTPKHVALYCYKVIMRYVSLFK